MQVLVTAPFLRLLCRAGTEARAVLIFRRPSLSEDDASLLKIAENSVTVQASEEGGGGRGQGGIGGGDSLSLHFL